jgi:anti-sigma regulatory factor (Ser/Thr protein kinase)
VREGVFVDGFYARPELAGASVETVVPGVGEPTTTPPSPALVAIYDALTAPPRVEQVSGATARELIDGLAARTYQAARDQVPYTVIREVVENFIHAGFDEVVVSVLDAGRTIRFADQGPGIRDKERAFIPGFTTATEVMKRTIRGVGSGLPVARECLRFSGGTIEIDDNLGSGTVVTLRLDAAPVAPVVQPPVVADEYEPPVLTMRQKQVLSLAMELGSVGPTVLSRELGVGLSTAYRDLEQLAGHGLLSADDAGKRVLTDLGAQCLDALLRK